MLTDVQTPFLGTPLVPLTMSDCTATGTATGAATGAAASAATDAGAATATAAGAGTGTGAGAGTGTVLCRAVLCFY